MMAGRGALVRRRRWDGLTWSLRTRYWESYGGRRALVLGDEEGDEGDGGPRIRRRVVTEAQFLEV